MRSCDSLMRISSGESDGVAQRHEVELDVHAAVAGGGELGGGAGEPGPAEVLDADDEVGGEELQACTR